MVSYRVKKKLDDWTCQYCGKEFQYPCRLIQHMKAKNKCNNSASTVNDSILSANNSDLTVNNRIQSMNNSVLAVTKIKLEWSVFFQLCDVIRYIVTGCIVTECIVTGYIVTGCIVTGYIVTGCIVTRCFVTGYIVII